LFFKKRKIDFKFKKRKVFNKKSKKSIKDKSKFKRKLKLGTSKGRALPEFFNLLNYYVKEEIKKV